MIVIQIMLRPLPKLSSLYLTLIPVRAIDATICFIAQKFSRKKNIDNDLGINEKVLIADRKK